MFGTKRPHQNGITLQFVKRFIERLWQTTDTETLQFCLAEIPWINVLRLARINLVLDAVQTCCNQTAQCKIRITTMVSAFQFKIDRLRIPPPERRWDTDRTFT